jgi:hypothetical protein
MPGFDHRLEHEEIQALVTYLIDLVHEPGEEDPDPPVASPDS